MRGEAATQATMLTAATPDALVPQSHPIRRIKPMVDSALALLSPTFSRMYASVGRPSIPPEHLLKGCLLMVLFSVRSERQLCERLEYDMLFKWFLDMNILDASFNHSVFSKNKERLLKADVSRGFFREIVDQARDRGLLSDEHFSVDGTLLEAWASMKSFRPKGEDSPPPGNGGRNRAVDFRGERRLNETHESRTDPFARLARRATCGHCMAQMAQAKTGAHSSQIRKQPGLGIFYGLRSAQGGNRTPTPLREADFKSAASAVSPPGLRILLPSLPSRSTSRSCREYGRFSPVPTGRPRAWGTRCDCPSSRD